MKSLQNIIYCVYSITKLDEINNAHRKGKCFVGPDLLRARSYCLQKAVLSLSFKSSELVYLIIHSGVVNGRNVKLSSVYILGTVFSLSLESRTFDCLLYE